MTEKKIIQAPTIRGNNLPLVVIFGRTNVGKSTLFNTLTEKRQALVSTIPGTTRDSNTGTVEWQGHAFEVVDTGGIMDYPDKRLFEKQKGKFETRPTEIDMVIGTTIFEAKLTESNFQKLKQSSFNSYPIFAEIFDERKLRDCEGSFLPVYQLLRNAAVRRVWECDMVVIIDERRKDLENLFNAFSLSFIDEGEKRKVWLFTWQEIANLIQDQSLIGFLHTKYGIDQKNECPGIL